MEDTKVKIYPSILSADFSVLGDEITAITDGRADGIHIDIMDGQFVPPITFGPMIVPFIKGRSNLPIDIHMMVINPERYFEELIEIGVDSITVHLEACKDIKKTLDHLDTFEVLKCVALNPKTSLENLFPFLKYIDRILIMSVEPGYGGQKFIPESLGKIERAKNMIRSNGGGTSIQVDGGVNLSTIKLIQDAGADIIVAGSAVFNDEDAGTNLQTLRKYAEGNKFK